MKKYSEILHTNIEMIGNECHTDDGVAYSIEDMNKMNGKDDQMKYATHLILREFMGELI